MDESTDQKRLAFAEEMGMLWEQMGATRMFGRVFGALLVADPPEMHAEDMAAFLHASRGSISQTTRQLIQLGLIERTRQPGIRKDFFRIRSNAWVVATRHQIREMDRLQTIFKRGLRAMDGAPPGSTRALEESLRFMEFWEAELQTLFERWNAYLENENGDRHSDT